MLLCNFEPVVAMPSNADISSCSDVSDGSDDVSGKAKCDDICRDYLRNVCKRGQRCKYRHPTNNEAKVLGQLHEYTFCHDFQNSGCRRPNCKFIHCTREEEEYYKQTGQIPVRVQQAAALGIGVLPKALPVLRGEVPICKDYLKGECKRAGRCKFRHLTLGQYDLEVKRNDQPMIACAPPQPNPTPIAPQTATLIDNTFSIDANATYEMAVKRRRLEVLPTCAFTNGFATAAAAFPAGAIPTMALTAEYLSGLSGHMEGGEHLVLKRTIDELKQQVTTLMATNDVLLEQNARFRQGPNKLCNVTITNAPPIVTVSQVMTPTITPAPIVARQQHPTPIMTPMVTAQQIAQVATAQQMSNGVAMLYEQKTAEILSLNQSQLASAQLAQFLAAPPLTSSLTQPIAIAPQTTNVIVPVSMIDSCLAQPGSLHQAQVSIAHDLHQRQTHNSAAVAINALAQTSMPLAQSMGSVHNSTLVSYPLISHATNHNARTIAHLANSSLALGCLQQTGQGCL